MTAIVTEGIETTATGTLNATPNLKTLGGGEMMGSEMNVWLLGAKGRFVSETENCAIAVTDLHGMEIVPTDAGLLEMTEMVGERDQVVGIGSSVKMVKTVMTAKIASAKKSLLGWTLTSLAMGVVESLAVSALVENWTGSRRLRRKCSRKTNPPRQWLLASRCRKPKLRPLSRPQRTNWTKSSSSV